MIDLRSLETFLWIAILGNFRAAARKLSVTQPAISTRIAALERDLGVTLFERGHQRAVLTPKGHELVNYAKQIIDLREQMRHLANERAAVRGQLRLGISDTLVHTWFAQLVERIHETYPMLALEIEVDITPNLSSALKKRALDIAFLVGPLPDAEMKNVPLVSYDMDWVASPRLKLPREPVSLEVVAEWPIITYLRNTRPHDVIQEILARAGISNARFYASASISTMIPMILSGVGIGALPSAVVQRELQAGRLRTVSVKNARLPKLHFVAAYPTQPGSFLAASVAKLARSIAERAPRL